MQAGIKQEILKSPNEARTWNTVVRGVSDRRWRVSPMHILLHAGGPAGLRIAHDPRAEGHMVDGRGVAAGLWPEETSR